MQGKSTAIIFIENHKPPQSTCFTNLIRFEWSACSFFTSCEAIVEE
jgi:hypothetical protein